MNIRLGFFFVSVFSLISILANSQSSEIIILDEKNAYLYKSYYKDGSLKSMIGFYANKPYSSVESFEEMLKKHKIKYHGERKEFYQSGQLKEIVVYKKGRVIEFAKHYFEDGEEFSVGKESMPEFQFDIQQQNVWFKKRIFEIESKHQINLEGTGIIILDISKDRTIKSINVRTPDESQKEYLLEIANQIKVVKPAMINGQAIGTRFAFRIEM